MSGTEHEETVWTKNDLQKLLAAMKTSIPYHDIEYAYPKGMRSLDWTKVAFDPFSPEACEEKWREILQKMRKIRTLTELIDEAEDAISYPHGEKKVHPNRPKRPAPPNSIFFEEKWAKYHEKHPNMSHQELFKYILKKYRALPEEKKATYVEKYKVELEKYKKSMAELCETSNKTPHHDGAPSKKRKKRSKDTIDASTEVADGNDLPPKPPFNGYNLFCKEQRASMTGVSQKTSVTVLTQHWWDLSERERDKYSRRCKELKTKYAVELNEYLMDFDEETQQQILERNGIKRPKERKLGLSGKTRKIPEKFPGEPKMPARSGNMIFFKHQMQLQKEKFPNTRECFLKVHEMWRELSKKKKEHYREEVNKNLRKYSEELQKWFMELPASQRRAYLTRNPSKLQFLDIDQMEMCEVDREEPCAAVYRPSDSEDEDLESSSSEEDNLDCYVVKEEEEDNDVIAFPAY